MSISIIETNNAINILNLNNSAKTSPVKNSDTEEISDNFSESKETSKFKEIVSKYDITSMSFSEMDEMAKSLYDNGFIDLKQLGFLTFDPSRMGLSRSADGTVNFNGREGSASSSQKLNFLEKFKDQAEFNKIYGEPRFQENHDMMVELAEKIKYFQS